jgi:hypothetical protein
MEFYLDRDRIRKSLFSGLLLGAVVFAGAPLTTSWIFDDSFPRLTNVGQSILLGVVLFFGGYLMIISIFARMYLRVEGSELIIGNPGTVKTVSLPGVDRLEKVLGVNGGVVEIDVVVSGRERLRLWGFEHMDELWELVSRGVSGSTVPISSRQLAHPETRFLVPGTLKLTGLMLSLLLVAGLLARFWGQHAVIVYIMGIVPIAGILSFAAEFRLWKQKRASGCAVLTGAVAFVWFLALAVFLGIWTFCWEPYFRTLIE